MCVTLLIHMCDITHSYVHYDSFTYVLIICMCDMTHWYVWHDSFICVLMCVTWLIYMCPYHSYVRHNSFKKWMNYVAHMNDHVMGGSSYEWVTSHMWIIHNEWVVCKMTHSYVSLLSICAIRLIHSYVQHCSSTCGTWLIHMWDITHSYVR